jgi:tight adherence protein C
MTALLILGLVLLAAAVTYIVRALAVPHGAGEALQRIDVYGFGGGEDSAIDEAGDNILDRAATAAGKLLKKNFSGFDEDTIRLRLVSAGLYSTTPARFLGYRLILSVTLLCLWVWLGGVSGYSIFGLIVGSIIACAVGWSVPAGYVWLKRRDRREKIEYELPEMIDLLVVAVEAGVSLPTGLRIAAREVTGPLGEELRLTLQEQNLGLSARDALENLGARANTPGMRIVVRGIVHGETLGMSIGQVLRNLAAEMRKIRKAAAEERAQKAPIKIIFPLVFLIGPAMLIVMIVPALLNLHNYFK